MTGKPEVMPDCGTNFRLADKPGSTREINFRKFSGDACDTAFPLP